MHKKFSSNQLSNFPLDLFMYFFRVKITTELLPFIKVITFLFLIFIHNQTENERSYAHSDADDNITHRIIWSSTCS